MDFTSTELDFPIMKTTTYNITNFKTSIINLTLFKSATLSVTLYDNDIFIKSLIIIIKDDDYLKWKDDEYIYEYVKNYIINNN